MEYSLFNPPAERKPITLRKYQEEAMAELKKGWLGNRVGTVHKNQLLVLATGLGKTICFAAISKWVREEMKGRVLVLAHREELLEQAEDKMRWVMGDAQFGREQASNRASVNLDEVVTASVATLGRSVTDPSNREFRDGRMMPPEGPNARLARFPKDHFKLVIIDEAHHSTASTYQNVLNHFEGAWVLGVTATPKRSDKESLKKIFTRVAFKMDIVEGMKQGHLCPVVSHRVSSGTDLSGIRTTAGDYNIKDLGERVNNAERNNLIVDAYLERCAASFHTGLQLRQAIIFATTVEHAIAIDAEFEKQGISSWAITGDMDKNERKEAIRRFKAGEIKVLTNYGVLTEGFDYEELDLIINARPTQSSLLLTQILGRGTRKPEHRPDKVCDFVEIIDNHSEQTATAAQIFGFNQTFDCQGNNFLDCIVAAENMEAEKDYFSAWVWGSWSDMWDRFKKAQPHDPAGSGWKQPSDEKDPTRFDSRYRYYATVGGSYRLFHNDRESGDKYQLRIDRSPMGGYEGTILKKANGEREEKRIYVFDGDTILDAAQKLEGCVLKNFYDFDILLNINSAWRKRAHSETCTDKQYQLMTKFRLTRGRAQSAITKAQAMEEISKFFNKG